MTGIVAAYILGTLIAIWGSPAVLAVGAAMLLAWRRHIVASWFVTVLTLTAFAFSAWHATAVMQSDLERRLTESAELVTEATVTGLIRQRSDAASFLIETRPEGRRLRVSWKLAPNVTPGDVLALRIKVRPVRSNANPAGFDLERWALAERVHGFGYVVDGRVLWREESLGHRLNELRMHLSVWLSRGDTVAARVFPALAVGDRQYLSNADYALLTRTGTSHLLAISGLHIALAAGLGLLLGRLANRIPGFRRLPIGPTMSIALALSYSALAGFSLSTQRAVVMLAIWWFHQLFWRDSRPVRVLTLAGGAVLLLDPLAAVSLSFWLSFGAVACLVSVASGRFGREGPVRRSLRAQGGIFAGMFPILGSLGLLPSLVALPANLLAIPWVSVLVVPAILGTVMVWMMAPPWAEYVMWLPGKALEALWFILEVVGAEPFGQWLAVSSVGGMAYLGLVLLLIPRGCGCRIPALLLIVAGLAGFDAELAEGEFRVHLLDVGQGLSVLVETREHALLYDAGPASSSGWNAGTSIVAPWLRQHGWYALDVMVISHGDRDHAGGVHGILDSGIRVGEFLATDLGRAPPAARPCLRGESFTWNNVRLEVLHPGPGLPYLGNDSSCVLRISGDGRTAIIPGDISKVVERRLVAEVDQVDLLIAAHHGSRTSSEPSWITKLNPGTVAFAVGFGNRFGMPHTDVLARVRSRRLISTAPCGYVAFTFRSESVRIESERARRLRPWHAGHREQRATQDEPIKSQYDCAL